MRKLAFFALAIVAVGCSTGPANETGSSGSEGAVPAIGDSGVTPAQVRAFDKLQAESGRSWTWMQHEDFATPAHLSGSRTASAKPLLVPGKSAQQATVEFVDQYRDLFKMKDAAAELSLSKSEVDHLAMTHVRFQQVMHGVPVAGAELAAHYDAQGRLTSIDANYIAGIQDLDLEPKITAKVSRDVAVQDVIATTKNVDESQLQASDGKLVIFARTGRPAALAFEYTVRAVFGDEPAIWVTKVDAKTGEILDRYNNLQTIEATGAGVLGDSKKFQVAQTGTTYTMTDTSRGVTISTYNANGQQVGPGQGAKAVTSTSLTSWDTGVGPGAAVDAHAYAGVVFDYYKKVHARNAIDGAGGAMLSTAHFGQAYDNAFWDGTGMSYGDGGDLFKPLSAGLDVVAHEFTHGVTEKTSNLNYQGQPGALNESVSDIFGVFIEHSLKPDDTKNWIMGENIAKTSTGLRDFKTPSRGQQPANMKSYVQTQQDNGGVHINSGIPNNAAFLMTMGGTNPTSGTAVKFGIGWEKSEALWYRANTKYFLSTTNFAQAAQAVMQAAKDITLTENEQNIIDCAWKATGVVQGACATTIVDPKAIPVPGAPGTGTGTDGDPGAGAATGTDTGTTDGTADDGTDGTSGTSGTTPKKKKTTLAPQDSAGCNVGGHGSSDFGPLAGILAAVLGLAASRRRASPPPLSRSHTPGPSPEAGEGSKRRGE
ncbi:MAG: Zinc metalloproteinase precursor [Labilithrix sp.]|nr:Zinc metalloproteinase precursor [Labilithrix sp.]